jgi:transcriptional regulator GlxA family with amidase domain
MTMLEKSSNKPTAAAPMLASGAAVKIMPRHARRRATRGETDAGRPDHMRPYPSERLASLLADAQAELQRLHSVTQRAGYKIFFRDQNGIIVDYGADTPTSAARPHMRGGLAPGALRRVRDYIEANLASRVDLGQLAATANLSRCHFAYAFKQSMGCPPHRYIMSRRLERARHLLLTSDGAIAEIAIASGFADQSHFSRAFRAFFDVSPLAFRRSRA